MCSCSESTLENEPELIFLFEDGRGADWDSGNTWDTPEETNYAIIGVRLQTGDWNSRAQITFTVREYA